MSQFDLLSGVQLEVVKDCYCEHYLHEITNYPRRGLTEKKLFKGDKVKFLEVYKNFYGTYLRVEKDNQTYDVLPENLMNI